MKKALILLLVGIGAAGMAANKSGTRSERAQARLARALEGRVAGPPISCVYQRDLRGNSSYGDDVILFEGIGGVLYVNRPAGGCPGLDTGRALVVRTTTSRLCRGDIATVLDPVSGTEFGGCGLGDFEPWRRPR